VSDLRAAHSADLLARLLGPAGEELTCEECFDRLDQHEVAKLRRRGRRHGLTTGSI
jgi:hypothetical protein